MYCLCIDKSTDWFRGLVGALSLYMLFQMIENSLIFDFISFIYQLPTGLLGLFVIILIVWLIFLLSLTL